MLQYSAVSELCLREPLSFVPIVTRINVLSRDMTAAATTKAIPLSASFTFTFTVRVSLCLQTVSARSYSLRAVPRRRQPGTWAAW